MQIKDVCQNCKDRQCEKTGKLCPGIEIIANQDYTPRQESYLGTCDLSELLETEPSENLTDLGNDITDIKKVICQMYFLDRRTQEQIADNIGISQPYVSKVINKVRKMCNF